MHPSPVDEIFVRFPAFVFPSAYRMIDQQSHHEPSYFIFSRTSAQAQQAQQAQQANAPGQGPYVFFLPIDKLCAAHKHHHTGTTPMVQIVQPAGVGRYIGVPKPAPAYLTSASVSGTVLTALPFLRSVGDVSLRNFL